MKKIFALAFFGATLVGGANAQILEYDALSTGATIAGVHMAANSSTSNEWGDQVVLSGPSHTIMQYNCLIQFNNGVNDTSNFVVNDTVTFRSLTGTGATATVNTGTPIYQATFSLGGATGLAGGAYNVGFGIPNVVVPTEFLVSNQFTRVSGNTGIVGEHFNNSPAAIGTGDPTYFWINNGTSWGQANFGTTPSGNMRMSLTATPEPASMAVLGIGALALIRRRRSNKA